MKWSALILTMLLAGCIKLLPDPGEPPKKLFLSPETSINGKRHTRNIILTIDRPKALSDLGSTKLRIIHQSGEVPVSDVIAGVEWEMKLPDLLQSNILASLEKESVFKGITRSDEEVRGDWLLISEIRHFEVVNLCDPSVKVELAFKLIATPGNTLVAQRLFQYQKSIECVSLSDILEAYTQIAEQMLKDLQTWLTTVQSEET